MDGLETQEKDSASVAVAERQDTTSGKKHVDPSQQETEQKKPQEEKFYTETEVNKRHGKLDSQIAKLTKETESYKKALNDLQSKIDGDARRKLDDDEKAALSLAGDDKDKRKQVADSFEAMKQNRNLTAENTRLKEQGEKVNALLVKLEIEDVDELIDLLERANQAGIESKVNELSETYGVNVGLIKPLAEKVTEPKELEALVKTLADNLPGGTKLPNPGTLRTIGVKTSDGLSPDELIQKGLKKLKK